MKARQYTLSDTLTFGKYRGKTIREVLSKDAEYLEWCKNKIAGFSIVEEIINSNNTEATYYSDGIEVLKINLWAQRCFKNAVRMAEDVKFVLETTPCHRHSCKQLEIAFV